MKIISIILISFFLLSLRGQESKRDLFCHAWLQFGYKVFGEKVPQSVNPDVIKTIYFFQNGTFTEESYIEKAQGKWIFNSDTTKFGIEYTLYNRQEIGNLSPITPAFLIIKLTDDTLIYGEEYHDPSMKYKHDDYYFVKEY